MQLFHMHIDAFDSETEVSVPFRILHVYAEPEAGDDVAVTVLIPPDKQVLHTIVGPALNALPTFSYQHALYQVCCNPAPSYASRDAMTFEQDGIISLQAPLQPCVLDLISKPGLNTCAIHMGGLLLTSFGASHRISCSRRILSNSLPQCIGIRRTPTLLCHHLESSICTTTPPM